MRKELEQRLVERWPQWFNTRGDIRHTAMPRGFTHDDGWFGILWRLCEDLEPLVAAFEQASESQFEVLQVEEKFGWLRIHVNHANDAIHQRIETAIQQSFHTCELCGQPGNLREESWIKTLCDEHAMHGSRKVMARNERSPETLIAASRTPPWLLFRAEISNILRKAVVS